LNLSTTRVFEPLPPVAASRVKLSIVFPLSSKNKPKAEQLRQLITGRVRAAELVL